MLYCRSNILQALDRALSRMIPNLCLFELEIKMVDEDEMAYNSKQKLGTCALSYFVFVKDKTESIFHLP